MYVIGFTLWQHGKIVISTNLIQTVFLTVISSFKVKILRIKNNYSIHMRKVDYFTSLEGFIPTKRSTMHYSINWRVFYPMKKAFL